MLEMTNSLNLCQLRPAPENEARRNSVTEGVKQAIEETGLWLGGFGRGDLNFEAEWLISDGNCLRTVSGRTIGIPTICRVLLHGNRPLAVGDMSHFTFPLRR